MNADLYHIIKDTFCGMWKYKDRGNTIEILTPFSTITSKFISVFITVRGENIIVTDGGWLEEGEYGDVVDDAEDSYMSLYTHFRKYHEVKQALNNGGGVIYFKSCKRNELVPNVVNDMANFIVSVVNGSQIHFAQEEEKEEKITFRRQANSFLSDIFTDDEVSKHAKLEFNYTFGLDDRNIKFNAGVERRSSVKLIKYVTGHEYSYFSRSISKATVDFQIAERIDKSLMRNTISQKIAVVDNSANGFDESRISEYMGLLESEIEGGLVLWSDKQKLNDLLR